MVLYVIISLWIVFLVYYGIRGGPAAEVAESLTESRHLSKGISYKKGCKWLSLFTLFLLWGLTAFRGIDIGNDTDVYVDIFNDIAQNGINFESRYEYGYQFLCLMISKISTEPQLFLLVTATIMYLGCGVYIFKYSKNIPVSVCMFYCFFFTVFTSMLRQGIAMMIVLYAYQAIKEKKTIKALILMLLGFSFHITAIVGAAFFFKKVVPKKPFVTICISIGVVVGSVAGILTELLLLVSPSFAHYFVGQYASSGWLAVSYEVGKACIFFLIVAKCYGKLDKEKEKETDIIVVNFTVLLLVNSLGFVMNLFTRLAQYFLLVSVVEMPNALMKKSLKNGRVLSLIICLIFVAYFMLVLLIRPEWQNVYPYHFGTWGR